MVCVCPARRSDVSPPMHAVTAAVEPGGGLLVYWLVYQTTTFCTECTRATCSLSFCASSGTRCVATEGLERPNIVATLLCDGMCVRASSGMPSIVLTHNASRQLFSQLHALPGHTVDSTCNHT
jgi:hypothetical protein